MRALYSTYDESLFSPAAIRLLGLQLTIDECSSSIQFLRGLKMMAEVQLKTMERKHKEETPTDDES